MYKKYANVVKKVEISAFYLYFDIFFEKKSAKVLKIKTIILHLHCKTNKNNNKLNIHLNFLTIMTKLELVNAIAEAAGLSKAAAKKALDATLGSIAGALKKGEAIILPGFGSFKVAMRGARKGINLRTKQAITIPAAKVAKFKPGKDLKKL